MLSRFSRSHRGDIYRQWRRISSRGAVSLRVFGRKEARAALLDFRAAFLAAYARIWDFRSEGNFFKNPGVLDFVERAISEGVASGWAHYSRLEVARKSVAWLVGLLDRGVLYYWIPTYDLDWASFSPGKLLISKLIEYFKLRGYRRLDFLTGDQDYKLAWKPELVAMRAIRWHG